MSATANRCRYGGTWFSEASGLPLSGGLGSPERVGRLLVAAVAHPRRAIALIALLLRAPTVDVALSDSAEGRVLRAYLGQRFLRAFRQKWLCQGVLVIPQIESAYLDGRRRRTVRTNLRRASAVGIRCERVRGSDQALEAAAVIVRTRRAPMTGDDLATLMGALPVLFAQPEVTVLLARGRAGDPLAVLAMVMDDEVCLIRYAVSSSHEARWALHHHLVVTLIERGVGYLIAAHDGPFGALGLSSNEQYYQHLLGYELCHVAITAPLTPPATKLSSSAPQAERETLPDHVASASSRTPGAC